jgi:hypothetical protein
VIELVLEDPSLSVANEFQIARALHQKWSAQNTDRVRRYRQCQRERGRCNQCPKPAKPGKKHCSDCTAKAKARVKLHRSMGRRKSRAKAKARTDNVRPRLNEAQA